MSDSISVQKQQLRQKARNRIENIPAFTREQASAQTCALLQSQMIWQQAQSIFFFSPLPNEVNISALIPEALRAGKKVLLPKFDVATNSYLPHHISDIETDLLPGKFGIHEPNGNCPAYPLNQLDLTLVPALAFDPLGRRLGRGRGFYDKLLAQVSGAKCGVAFDEQIVAEIPIESHDVPVDFLLTPTRWIAVTRATT